MLLVLGACGILTRNELWGSHFAVIIRLTSWVRCMAEVFCMDPSECKVHSMRSGSQKRFKLRICKNLYNLDNIRLQ